MTESTTTPTVIDRIDDLVGDIEGFTDHLEAIEEHFIRPISAGLHNAGHHEAGNALDYCVGQSHAGPQKLARYLQVIREVYRAEFLERIYWEGKEASNGGSGAD